MSLPSLGLIRGVLTVRIVVRVAWTMDIGCTPSRLPFALAAFETVAVDKVVVSRSVDSGLPPFSASGSGEAMAFLPLLGFAVAPGGAAVGVVPNPPTFVAVLLQAESRPMAAL